MKLGIGTVQFGQKYGISNPDVTIPTEKIHSILDYYLKHNNLIDTAKNYGNCEEIIGDYIQKKKELYLLYLNASYYYIL